MGACTTCKGGAREAVEGLGGNCGILAFPLASGLHPGGPLSHAHAALCMLAEPEEAAADAHVNRPRLQRRCMAIALGQKALTLFALLFPCKHACSCKEVALCSYNVTFVLHTKNMHQSRKLSLVLAGISLSVI